MAITDLLSKVGVPGTVTSLAAPGKAIAATSINITSATNWETSTAVYFAIRVVDPATVSLANPSGLVANTFTEWKGQLAGNVISGLQLKSGTDQVYAAGVNTQVFIHVSPARENSLVDWGLAHANQDGTLKANAVITAVIADGAVTTAKIPDGAVTNLKLATTVKRVNLIQYNRVAATTVPMFPETGSTGADFNMVVPTDYVSGDLTIKLAYRAAGAGGVVNIVRFTYRFRENAPILAIDNNIGVDTSTADTNTRIFSFTIAATNFTAGDIIRLDLRRNQADSSTQPVEFDGLWCEYLGRV